MLSARLIGRLGSDADLRYAASGQAVLRFNVAANYRTRNPEGEWQDRTEWVRVAVLGQRAESISPYLRKGTQVYVEGRLEARPWTDQHGRIRSGLEVLASEVQFMVGRDQDARPEAVSPETQGADQGVMEAGVRGNSRRIPAYVDEELAFIPG